MDFHKRLPLPQGVQVTPAGPVTDPAGRVIDGASLTGVTATGIVTGSELAP